MIHEHDDLIIIELGPFGMEAFNAADWRVDRPEPPKQGRLYLKDISAREEKGPPFGLLEVTFEGSDGGHYWWRPHWDDVADLFYKGFMTEICNMKGDQDQLDKFRDVGEKILELSRPAHPGPAEG